MKIFIIFFFLITIFLKSEVSLFKNNTFKCDTTKFYMPIKVSSYDFKTGKIVCIQDTKVKSEKVRNSYISSSLGRSSHPKTALLYELNGYTTLTTNGIYRDSFDDASYAKIDDKVIIVSGSQKVGVWNSESIQMENLYQHNNHFMIGKVYPYKNKIFASGYSTLLIDSSKTCVMVNFESSKYEENTLEEVSFKGFYDISKFQKNYKIRDLIKTEEPFMKRHIEFLNTASIFANSNYALKKDNFFVINCFGAEILEYDYDLNILNKFGLDEIVKLRDIELGDLTDINQLKGNKRASSVTNFFHNDNNNTFIIQYKFSKFMQENGYPETEIFIFSIDKNKIIDRFPFKGDINGYDPTKNRISILNNIDDSTFEVEIYEIK
ncbi:MAG: hypothetical protein JXR48_02970 [Candidatus Delongbacteria bacterium]|nr:hypothetical protein [Candidatus Delongbacteria bacterium]MBN2833910.1 hypothetical protein [Candidatus Delongbacteria bacterium]